MYLIKYVFYSLLLMSGTLIVAQERTLTQNEVDQLNEGVQKMNQNTNSISAQFIQYKNLSFLDEKVKSNGDFYFAKEAKIRWEYKEPSPYIIVLNEEKVYIDNQKEKKSFDSNSGKGFKALNSMIVKSMDGSIAEDDQYNVKYFMSGEDYRISLSPKSKNLRAFVKEINLFIDHDDFSVNSIQLVESDEGDYTDIQFKDKKINAKIDPSLFSGF